MHGSFNGGRIDRELGGEIMTGTVACRPDEDPAAIETAIRNIDAGAIVRHLETGGTLIFFAFPPDRFCDAQNILFRPAESTESGPQTQPNGPAS